MTAQETLQHKQILHDEQRFKKQEQSMNKSILNEKINQDTYNEQLKKQIKQIIEPLNYMSDMIEGITKVMDFVGILLTGGVIIGAGALINAFKDFKDQNKGYDFGVSETIDRHGNIKPFQKSTSHISEEGLKELKNREGFDPIASDKGDGKWTIGHGHTAGVKPGDTITREQADKLLRKEVKHYENIVNNTVKVPLGQNMFDALTILCYNIPSALTDPKSSVIIALNKGDYVGAANAMLLYDKYTDKKTNKKVFSQGLHNRRVFEKNLFLKDVDLKTGKLKGNIINTKRPIELAPTPKQGRKPGEAVGNYVISKDASGGISTQTEQFLKEVGGKGRITSGIRYNTTQFSERSHESGNKFDIGLGWQGENTDNYIIARICELSRHDALVHIALEGLTKDHNTTVVRANSIAKKIKNNYPSIAQKMIIIDSQSSFAKNYTFWPAPNKFFLITYWGNNQYEGKGYNPHLDVCFNPYLLIHRLTQFNNEAKIKQNRDKYTTNTQPKNNPTNNSNNNKVKNPQNTQNKLAVPIEQNNNSNISPNARTVEDTQLIAERNQFISSKK